MARSLLNAKPKQRTQCWHGHIRFSQAGQALLPELCVHLTSLAIGITKLRLDQALMKEHNPALTTCCR